ncbi:MAG: hypothetical protein Q8O89_04120 [Nanoarchaeota archaeon]|nr:hypothetical protein [Nanoarchaeota archaeon]
MIPSIDEKPLINSVLKFYKEKYAVSSRENVGYVNKLNTFIGKSKKIAFDLISAQLKKVEPILDKDFFEIIVDAHGDAITNELELYAGQSGGALSQKGCKKAKSFLDEKVQGQIIISSDLPRTIHHSIAKYFPEKLDDEKLLNLIEKTPSSLEHNFGIMEKETHIGWVRYALDLGIIPTPLLRSQFYGLMELFPEKTIDERIEKLGKKWKENGKSDDEIKAEINSEKIRLQIIEKSCCDLQMKRFEQLGEKNPKKKLDEIMNALVMKSSIYYCMEGKDWQPITEVKTYMDIRVKSFMSLFLDKKLLYELVFGKRIQIVTHSGTIDNLYSFFGEYDSPGQVRIIKREKLPSRGESFLVRMDAPNGKIRAFRYLNDPAIIQSIISQTEKEISTLRENFPDEKVRKGTGIVKTEFYTLRKDESNKDIKKSCALEELLNDNSPSLVLANCGLGKTTCCLDLASRLMPENSIKNLVSEEYIPVFIRLRETKSIFDQEIKNKTGKSEYETLMAILTGGVSHLAEKKIETYRNNGKNFVFILDGFDELHHSLKPIHIFDSLVSDMSKLGKVIITSRYESFSEYESGNLGKGGVKTYNIDPASIIKNLDSYLSERFENKAAVGKLSEFIKNQSSDVKNNWLMVYFITEIYKENPGSVDTNSQVSPAEIMQKGIELFVWEHARRRNPSLFSYPPKTPSESDLEYKENRLVFFNEIKNGYLEEIMPKLQKIAAYMTVNDKTIISHDETLDILKGRWSLKDELEKRKTNEK